MSALAIMCKLNLFQANKASTRQYSYNSREINIDTLAGTS
jgi:hypothetical protein